MIEPIDREKNLRTGIDLLIYIAAHPHTEAERYAAVYCAKILEEELQQRSAPAALRAATGYFNTDETSAS